MTNPTLKQALVEKFCLATPGMGQAERMADIALQVLSEWEPDASITYQATRAVQFRVCDSMAADIIKAALSAACKEDV